MSDNTCSIMDDDIIVDSLKIDFTDPAFMTRSIKYEKNFEELNIINEECRSRMVRTSCDQTCFYVLCALKAFELIGEIPTIVVYGGNGVMGSCLIDALVECGCKPFLKIFARDSVTVQKWLKIGIRSTVQFDALSKMDILIIASNLASFSQLCRDVGVCLRTTTFVISTVFALQRKRVYNLFESCGVVRTFVERKMSKRKKFSSAKLLLYRKDSMKNLFLIVENYMVMLGIEPSVARELLFDIFLGKNNVQPHSAGSMGSGLSRPSSSSTSHIVMPFSRHASFQESENENDEDGDTSPTLTLPSMSPAHSSSDIFTPIKPSSSRRTSGEDMSSTSTSMSAPFSPQSARSTLFPASPSLPSIHESHLGSRPSTRENNAYAAMRILELSGAIDELHSAYGILFAEELSKHVDEMKLPSMRTIQSSKVLSPMPKRVKPKRFRRRSMRENKEVRVPDTKKYSGYLDADALLRIFNSDKKSAPDVKTSTYLEYINSLSEDEDDGAEEEEGEEESLDFGLERFSDDIFDTPEPEEEKCVVKSGIIRSTSGIPMISRLESDTYVGENEGKRFNVPSTLDKIEC